MSYAGKIFITCIQCFNIKSMDTIGESDPYIKLNVGKLKSQTKVVEDNANPYFNEQFVFDYEPSKEPHVLTMELWDKDAVGSDDYIGFVHVPFEEFLNAKGTRRIPFYSNKGELVGDGDFDIYYEAPTAPKFDPKISKHFASAKVAVAPPVQTPVKQEASAEKSSGKK
ncbi:MAG: hypothetical protein EZS28_011839 [Streblomastix strix]|uniref:C2 domain-containing protein n=1 Tax=Streblomastix strix TaxID=222440 RepID=A0A5J4WCK9_9EUKA|nr:MAG: hypothetical protein EZS28_011839 [Streblomastix strix]